MGIIDDIASDIGYVPKQKEAREEWKPSSYNPFISYPESLWQDIKETGRGLYSGASRIGKGEVLGGGFEAGMSALRAPFIPLEAGVQTLSYPIAEETGIPEEYLRIGGMLAAPAGGARLAGRLGLGASRAARGAETAAPREAERLMLPAPETGPTPLMLPRPGAPMPGGGSAADMLRPRGSDPYDSTSHYYRGVGGVTAPEGEVEEITARRMPAMGTWQDQMRSGSTGERSPGSMPPMGDRPTPPQQMLALPPPAMRMPDLRPKWGRPEYESGIPMGDTRPGWQRPASMPTEEMFGGRRMFPEQQLPDYTLEGFTRRASEASGRVADERAAALRSKRSEASTRAWEARRLAAVEGSVGRFKDLTGSPSEEALQAAGAAREYMGLPATKTKQVASRAEPTLTPSRQLTEAERKLIAEEDAKRTGMKRASEVTPKTKTPAEPPTKFQSYINQGTAIIRGNLADHGMISGMYTTDGLVEVLQYSTQAQGRALTKANAQRVIEHWKKQGIVQEMKVGGEPHYYIDFEVK